jgi:dTDP-4-dehydrorhamnose reductase
MAKTQRVLVTGGSGYLGQFLVQACADAGHELFWTYCSTTPAAAAPGTPLRVDLRTGEGLEACLAACGALDIVVNTAALSQPGACARDGTAAAAINVPERLLAGLALSSPNAFLLHVSTDQVYDGSRACSTEADAEGCTQANAYGVSKAAAETAVRAAWPRHAILRSSIIYGPPPPFAPVARALFLQWLDGALAAGPVELFEDEWRSPIFVFDLVAIILGLAAAASEPGAFSAAQPVAASLRSTLNCGGPERLSRADMGDAVAVVRAYPRERVLRVPSASVVRTPASPADISMDVRALEAALPAVRLTPFSVALRLIYT